MKEFSKRIVKCFVWVFALHTLLTLAALVLCTTDSRVTELYTASIAVYMTVFGGYFGKAAVENVKKISTKADTTQQSNG